MAIIIRHNETKQLYVLVGTSYSYFKDSRPSFFGGDLFPHEEEGLFDQVAAVDEAGRIHWFATEQIKVVQVDGKDVRDILMQYKSSQPIETTKAEEAEEYENCPGCGGKVGIEESICPYCGLTLILEE